MFVYKLTNKITGKSYVGATTNSLPRRLDGHWQAAKKGRTTLICAAIREFGAESFEAKILTYASSFEELMLREIEAIRREGTLEPNGYNRASGGIGTPDCRHLESTKLKMSQKAMGRTPWNKGKIGAQSHSAETRQKISARLTGHEAWNRGVPATPAHKEKLLAAARRGGENHHARPVEVNGVIYPCIGDAVVGSGLSRMQVRSRLKNGQAKYLNPPEKGITKEKDKQ